MFWEFLQQRGLDFPHPRLDSIGASFRRRSLPAGFGVSPRCASATAMQAPPPAVDDSHQRDADLAIDDRRLLDRSRTVRSTMTSTTPFCATGRTTSSSEPSLAERDCCSPAAICTSFNCERVAPCLLDGGGLDGLAYSLQAAPAMDRILGGRLRHRPVRSARGSAVPRRRAVGIQSPRVAGYSTDRWREIKAEYNVTQVLVPSDWALSCPSSRRAAGTCSTTSRR